MPSLKLDLQTINADSCMPLRTLDYEAGKQSGVMTWPNHDAAQSCCFSAGLSTNLEGQLTGELALTA